MDRLEEIRQRAEAATPGTWKTVTHEEYSTVDVDEQGGENIAMVGSAIADADFIANAREDIPHLLSEVDRLNALHKREIIVTGEYAQRVIDLTARAEAAEAERDRAIKQMCALARLNSNIFDNDFGNHIAELIVAEQDGRLLVLPCPFYSEVYALAQVGNEIIHGELRSTNKDYCLIVNLEGSLTSKGKTWHGVQVRMQDVFPTRPEAEAAMKGGPQ